MKALQTRSAMKRFSLLLLISLLLLGIRPLPAAAAPAAPTGLVATASDSAVSLTWTAVPGASSYNVYRSTTGGSGYTQVAAGLTSTGYTDLYLYNRQAYYYVVTATDGTGESNYSAGVSTKPNAEPYAWHFNRSSSKLEGWNGESALSKSVVNGDMVLAISGSNPYIYSPSNLQMDAAKFNSFQIRMKNATTSTTGELFWNTTTDATWRSVAFTITSNDSGYSTYTVNLNGNAYWNGTISQIRLDSTTASSGYSYVDYVKFTGSYTPKAPLFGAIRWDAWFPNNTSYTPIYVDPTLYTDYDYRQPFYGWYNAGITGHASIIDQEIDYAAAGLLDYWAFVWYPYNVADSESSQVWPGLGRELMQAFNDYYVSSKKNKIKFAFIIETSWAVGGDGTAGTKESFWRSRFVPDFVSKFSDSQYVKVEGNRPLVYWMNTSSLDTQPTGLGSNWATEMQYLIDQTVAAGLGEPYFVDVDNNPSEALAFGFEGISHYGLLGIQNGSTHQSYNDLAALDKGVIAQSVGNLKHLPGITPLNDHRARNAGSEWALDHGSADTFWFDLPTYSQWEDTVKFYYDWLLQYPGRSSDPGATLIYAWNEIDEGGQGIVPTLQDGTMFLDGIKAAKSGSLPAEYTDTINDSNLEITYSGTWNWNFPVATTHNNDEHSSSTTGSFAELTWNNAIGFELTGTKGTRKNGRLHRWNAPSYR